MLARSEESIACLRVRIAIEILVAILDRIPLNCGVLRASNGRVKQIDETRHGGATRT
ncbi:MAG: hypothetical protein U0941_02785 [Planctomycetaceae bacterium]